MLKTFLLSVLGEYVPVVDAPAPIFQIDFQWLLGGVFFIVIFHCAMLLFGYILRRIMK